MKQLIENYLKNKKVLIAGFGKEGRSTLRFLQANLPQIKPAVADKNVALEISDEEKAGVSDFFLGEKYQDSLAGFDVIIKSPGMDFRDKMPDLTEKTILSQTSLFVEKYHRQIIGITGSKGKSTTSSLIYHILKESGLKTILVGNIGLPALDFCDQIGESTMIVFEMSAHQLEIVSHSPHIAVLLNLYQEHLDYFRTFENYALAKLNILKFQSENDFCLLPDNNRIPDIEGINLVCRGKQIRLLAEGKNADFYLEDQHFVVESSSDEKIDISGKRLYGNHNLRNILTATAVCRLAGAQADMISAAVSTFQPLEHRLEYVGNFAGIDFFNDSISTIPEATTEAVKTVQHAETLILGGFDRGIDYDGLVDFLGTSQVRNFIFTGPAGKRIARLFEPKKAAWQRCFTVGKFAEIAALIREVTSPGKACLLSPAASSYDEFKNFEERGSVFKKIARNL